MCGATQKDKIMNEYVQGAVTVMNVSIKATERRMKWLGLVRRRPLEHCRSIMGMKPHGREDEEDQGQDGRMV